MKVACVVVTYNRKKNLLEALNAILKQSRKVEEIIIIDNHSVDGTEEELKSNGYLDLENITYIYMKENLGGSGGFHSGIKIAFDKGYDWIWTMDDDGIPSYNCLENLLDNSEKSYYIAPLVLNIDNNEELSFNYEGSFDLKELLKRNKEKGYVENYACPFNGILFSRNLIENIGLPKKDMFIWGDETEFYLRTLSSETTPVTILSAVHYHPRDKQTFEKTLFGSRKVLYPKGKLKQYCYYRNFTYITKKYYGIRPLLTSPILHTYFFIITKRFNIEGLFLYYHAYFDGITENFSNHRKYL